jgi:hypothetical protein
MRNVFDSHVVLITRPGIQDVTDHADVSLMGTVMDGWYDMTGDGDGNLCRDEQHDLNHYHCHNHHNHSDNHIKQALLDEEQERHRMRGDHDVICNTKFPFARTYMVYIPLLNRACDTLR